MYNIMLRGPQIRNLRAPHEPRNNIKDIVPISEGIQVRTDVYNGKTRLGGWLGVGGITRETNLWFRYTKRHNFTPLSPKFPAATLSFRNIPPPPLLWGH